MPVGPATWTPDADLAPGSAAAAPAPAVAPAAAAAAGLAVATTAAGGAVLATSHSSNSKPVAPKETVLDVHEAAPVSHTPEQTIPAFAEDLEAGTPAPQAPTAAVAAGAGVAVAAGAAAGAAAVSVRSRRGSSEKQVSSTNLAVEAQAPKAAPVVASAEAGASSADTAAEVAAKPKATTWMSAFGWGSKEAKPAPAPPTVAPAVPVADQAPTSTPAGAQVAAPPSQEPSAGPPVAAAAAVGAVAAGAGIAAAAVASKGRKEEEEQKQPVDAGSNQKPAEEVPHNTVPLPVLRSLSAAYLREDDPRATSGATQDPTELSNEGMVAAAAAAAAAVGGGAAVAGVSHGGVAASGRASSRLPELQEDSDTEGGARFPTTSSKERVTPPMPLPPPAPVKEEVEEREVEGEETDDDDDDEDEVAVGPRWFGVSELAQGTVGFSDARVLGAGRYGTVYKATLADGTNVAVKRLGSGTQ